VAWPGTDIVSELVNVSDMAGKDAWSHADTTEATYTQLAMDTRLPKRLF
jgi:hypothetical protein